MEGDGGALETLALLTRPHQHVQGTKNSRSVHQIGTGDRLLPFTDAQCRVKESRSDLEKSSYRRSPAMKMSMGSWIYPRAP